MSGFAMPARRWGDEPAPEAPRPVVLVSSRDGAPVPHVPGAARLVRTAESARWRTRQTYALADVPATARRPAHRLASVAVRLARGASRGWACWHRVDEDGWRYAAGQINLRRLGARELTAAVATSETAAAA